MFNDIRRGIFFFFIGLINLILNIGFIDKLVTYVNSHMLTSAIIMFVVNVVLIIVSYLFGNEGDEVSHEPEAYSGAGFAENYEKELHDLRERETLEELKKINSKLS